MPVSEAADADRAINWFIDAIGTSCRTNRTNHERLFPPNPVVLR